VYELFLARRYLLPRGGADFSRSSPGSRSAADPGGSGPYRGPGRDERIRARGEEPHRGHQRPRGDPSVRSQGLRGPTPWWPPCARIRRSWPPLPSSTAKAMIFCPREHRRIVSKGVGSTEGESEVTRILDYIERPPGAFSLNASPGELPGVVLGVHVAENSVVTTGERVQLLAPQVGAASPLGYLPRVRNFRVAGSSGPACTSTTPPSSSWAARGAGPAGPGGADLRGGGEGWWTCTAPRRWRGVSWGAWADFLPGHRLDRDERPALLLMQMEKRVMFHHPHAHRHGGGLQHTGLAHSPGHGEAARHRDSPFHGGDAGRDRIHLHPPGRHHRLIGMVPGRGGRLTSLPPAVRSNKFIRLPGDIYFIDTLPVRWRRVMWPRFSAPCC